MADRDEGVPEPNQWQQQQNQQQENQQQQQQQQQVQDPAGPLQQHLHLKWSNFKPEFSGKPDEDAEAHLLYSKDWMNSHHFLAGVKVQRLLGETSLWYHSLEPINVDLPELQNLFRQRYWKVGNMQEQLFHALKSFNFDENIETTDAYVTWIRQVATLLGYGEPQILEVFKNKLPTKLYWILFSIEDLRQAVETVKRILALEKLDKQLTGQTSTSPFMSIRKGTNRKVSFDTRDELENKIDKLTVMLGRLAAKDNNEKKSFKPQIYQSRGRGQSTIRIETVQAVGIEDSLGGGSGRPWFEQNYRGNNFQESARGYGRQNSRGEYSGDNYRHDSYNRGMDRSRERSFSGNYSGNRTRSASNSRSRLGSRASTNTDRIRCYNFREYDHFARDSHLQRRKGFRSIINKCWIWKEKNKLICWIVDKAAP